MKRLRHVSLFFGFVNLAFFKLELLIQVDLLTTTIIDKVTFIFILA